MVFEVNFGSNGIICVVDGSGLLCYSNNETHNKFYWIICKKYTNNFYYFMAEMFSIERKILKKDDIIVYYVDSLNTCM